MDKPRKTVRKRPRRTFTTEFKAEAVRLCKVGDCSIRQVVEDRDLTETALREWVHRADSIAPVNSFGRDSTPGIAHERLGQGL